MRLQQTENASTDDVEVMTSGPVEQSLGVERVASLLGLLAAFAVLGSSMIAVALPQVAQDLQLTTSGMAWVLGAFSLPFAISTAVFGRVADAFGFRVPLVIGVLVFTAGAAVAAGAWSYPSLILGRALEGSGAGAIPVLVVAIIAIRFEGDDRGWALGRVTAMVAIASASGPLLGGLVADLVGWRAVLAVPVFAALILVPVGRVAPPAPPEQGSVDLIGAVLLTATVAGGILLLQVPASEAGLAALCGVSLLTGASAVATIRHVKRRPHGFLPQDVICNRRLVLCSLCGLGIVAPYIAGLFSLPVLLEREWGWSSLQIGLGLVPAAGLSAVVSQVTGRAGQVSNQLRLVAVLAMASAAATLVAALFGSTPVLLLVALAVVLAVYAGGRVALLDVISQEVTGPVAGAAFSFFNFTFFAGAALGSAIMAAFSDVIGIRSTLACVAILPALGSLAALAARVGSRAD